MFFRKVKEINPKEEQENIKYDNKGRRVEQKQKPKIDLKI